MKINVPWVKFSKLQKPGAFGHRVVPIMLPLLWPPPSRQVLGCAVCFEGIWELKQMSYQKCFFLFGGRIREQCGLLNLCVWRWKDVGSYCQIIFFWGICLPWTGSAFKLGLGNQVLTASTHSARDLLCGFNFNSLEYFGYALKSQSPYVLGGRKGNILYAYVIHMYVAI